MQKCCVGNCHFRHTCNTFSYPLFADADTVIYPHATSQYHARTKAKLGMAKLSVDRFRYPRQQTRCNEFIPCSQAACHILKSYLSFVIPAIPLVWRIKQCYSVEPQQQGKWVAIGIAIVTSSMTFLIFISHADDTKSEISVYISRLSTNRKRE